jgi:hypothetical protein
VRTDLRDQLADLLTDAAEVEHSLVCQYLFTAFSLKRHPDEGGVTWAQLEAMRRWEVGLLLIARQEMEHLGLVSNLLTAIGEAPHFTRPNFPISSQYFPVSDPPSLEGFGLRQLRRFIQAERPDDMTDEHASTLQRAFAALEAHSRSSDPLWVRSKPPIGRLYSKIKDLFHELGQSASLFIGPPSAQRTTLEIIPVPIRGLTIPANASIYDVGMKVVTDLKSALAVIDQIVLEGEGAPNAPAGSHFGRLVAIVSELKTELDADPAFEPARPVLANPTREQINNPETREVYDVFETAYETTVVLLLRYFALTDETPAEVHGVQQAVFFPMMTTVLRPLGEILTQLPAHDCAAPRAGPGFRFARRLAFPPHRLAAWKLIDLELAGMAGALDRIRKSGAYPRPIHDRLTLVYENVERIGWNFRQKMQLPAQS